MNTKTFRISVLFDMFGLFRSQSGMLLVKNRHNVEVLLASRRPE